VVRSLGTALVAVVFSILACSVADARSHSGQQAGGVGSAAMSQDSEMPAVNMLVVQDPSLSSVPAPDFVVVTPRNRVQLNNLDTAWAAPTANADEKMWSSDASGKHTSPIGRFAKGVLSRTSSIALRLTRTAMRFIGTPYVFGGTSAAGFDCSGYVQHVFASIGLRLPRTADAQFYAGSRAAGGIAVGDLVFFQTYEPGPSHVGIYIGNGTFVHSSSHGVRVSKLGESYWASRYLGAKRYVPARAH